MKPDFGVITLAIPKDYKKAIALSLTLKEHTPNVPISIVCPESLREKVSLYFDKVIIERNDLEGFEHKLYLDQYSPYEKTFFFDADILIIKDILPTVKKWAGSAYAVRGSLVKEGVSSFGLDREKALSIENKENFSLIDGAGHAYFEKPACQKLFDTARNVREKYTIYDAPRFADEDAIGIAMTILGIKPKDNEEFLGSPCCSIGDSFFIDTDNATCYYDDLLYGKVFPCIVHFPSFVYPFTYGKELVRTFRRHDVKISGVWRQAIKEVLILQVKWPLGQLYKKVRAAFRVS